MREILFRGKRLDNGEWIEGYYFERKDTRGNIIESVILVDAYEQITSGQRYVRSNLNQECFRVDFITIGQFTGLTDKNGKKIFEGDLLNGFQYPFYRSESAEHNYFAEVIWFTENCAFGLYTHKHPTAKVKGISAGNADFIEDFNSDDWEIIGNIHDKPELLEGRRWQMKNG